MTRTKWDDKWDDLAREERQVLEEIEQKDRTRWKSQEVLEEFDLYGQSLQTLNYLSYDYLSGSRYAESFIQTLDENMRRNYANLGDMDELISDLRRETSSLEDGLDELTRRRQKLMFEEEEDRKNGN